MPHLDDRGRDECLGQVWAGRDRHQVTAAGVLTVQSIHKRSQQIIVHYLEVVNNRSVFGKFM